MRLLPSGSWILTSLSELFLLKLPIDLLESLRRVVFQIKELDTAEVEESIDNTWIVYAQSPDQIKMIEEHPKQEPLYLEGAFVVYLRGTSMSYFVLRAEPREKDLQRKKKVEEMLDQDQDDDLTNMTAAFKPSRKDATLEDSIMRPSSVHIQDDGIILGLACTGELETNFSIIS